MDNSSQVSIIIIACISSFILFSCCYKCYRDNSKEKNKNNNLIFKKRVKPISEMTNKELNNEFEKFGIRPPEIFGEENT